MNTTNKQQLNECLYQIENLRQGLRQARALDHPESMEIIYQLQNLFLIRMSELEQCVRALMNQTMEEPMGRFLPSDLILVFSDQYQDGIVMSQKRYYKWVRTIDRADFECHQAIAVAKEMVGDLQQVLDEDVLVPLKKAQ